jgi:hypothetical protein
MILVRSAHLGRRIRFGQWTELKGFADDEVGNLIGVVNAVGSGSVINQVPEPIRKASPHGELFAADSASLFDDHQAAEDCILQFRKGWLPYRALLDASGLVLDCSPQWSSDYNFLIHVREQDGDVIFWKLDLYRNGLSN